MWVKRFLALPLIRHLRSIPAPGGRPWDHFLTIFVFAEIFGLPSSRVPPIGSLVSCRFSAIPMVGRSRRRRTRFLSPSTRIYPLRSLTSPPFRGRFAFSSMELNAGLFFSLSGSLRISPDRQGERRSPRRHRHPPCI